MSEARVWVLDLPEERPTGIGFYAERLIEGLARSDWADRVGILQPPTAARERRLRTEPLPLPRGPFARLRWSNRRATASAVLRPRDLLHDPHQLGLAGRCVARKVMTLHDLTPITHPSHFAFPVNRLRPWALRATLRSADRVIAVSEATAREAVSGGLCDAGRLRATPLAPRGWTGVVPAEESVRRPYLLCVGTNEARKRWDYAIRIFEQLHREDPTLGLVFVGKDAFGASILHDAIARSPAKDDIVRLGYADDATLLGLYRGCRALLVTSHTEGFGLTILEALGQGRLVASSARLSGEFKEAPLVRLDAADASTAAAQLATALDRPTTVESLRTFAARFTWDATVRATIEVYDELLKEDSP